MLSPRDHDLPSEWEAFGSPQTLPLWPGRGRAPRLSPRGAVTSRAAPRSWRPLSCYRNARSQGPGRRRLEGGSASRTDAYPEPRRGLGPGLRLAGPSLPESSSHGGLSLHREPPARPSAGLSVSSALGTHSDFWNPMSVLSPAVASAVESMLLDSL